ncbi:esterase/lipase family protein [Burkholderia sp. LMG 21824]|uniref:esterase/lipase family protein n=1 Tax=Burkholderia sp. LMG 21824 TaxID=3158172 RepID=UPI003C3010B8
MREIGAALIAVILCVLSTAALAVDLSYIPFTKTTITNPLDATSAVIAFKQAAKSDAALASELDGVASSLAVVFVPGILGSALEDTATQKKIWGNLSLSYLATHYDDFIANLALPPALIDENARSTIRPTVLESMAGMDFYGKALRQMKQATNDLHIRFLACGYDWRRDIRSGAQDLDRCIDTLPAGSRIIIVAHSMGGLVSWQWAMQHAHDVAPTHRLMQLVTLGSPLVGSCEIIRMIEQGYVQPTVGDKVAANNQPLPNPLEGFATLLGTIKSSVVNDVTSALTQGVRPLILTWPGAIELTPRPSNRAADFICLHVPRPGRDMADTQNVSYYDPAFWVLPIGHSLLGRYELPPQYKDVLAKARDFRSGFVAAPLDVPVWLYYSVYYEVPNQRETLVDAHKTTILAQSDRSKDGWDTVQGDGRVPLTSANLASAPQDMFSNTTGLLSPHGDLPADPGFQRDFLDIHLPNILDTIVATTIAQESTAHPQWLSAYVAAGGSRIDASAVQTALAPATVLPDSAMQLDASTRLAIDSANRFSALVCATRPCDKTLDAALANIKAQAPQYKTLAAVVNFDSVARTLDKTNPNFVFAQGQKGLALAEQHDWLAAAHSLKLAIDASHDIQASSPVDKPKLAALTGQLTATKARALYEAGYCRSASPLLKTAAAYDAFSSDALKRPCNDRAGVLFCFDSDDYCKK